MRIPGALEALREECQAISDVVLPLSEEDFACPVRRTPAWNVKELLGHMYRDVERTIVGLRQDAPERPDTDAVSYWRAYDPADDAADIADRAKLRAASYGAGRELAIAWDDMWRRAMELAEAAPSTRPILTWAPVLTLDDFLKTRVVEITVHGLDLADALGRPPWATDDGVRVTREVLVGCLGQEPPEGLGWDDVALLDKGTGRSALTQDERATLGPLAGRFPLLS